MFDPHAFSFTQARKIQTSAARAEAQLMAKPNVVGYGVGVRQIDGEWTHRMGISVLVERKMPVEVLRAEDLVPAEIEGVETDVLEVGKLVAQANRKTRWRPAPPGVSIGHVNITAGTLGAIVTDRYSGRKVILSNNHVLANENDANLGDSILQPGAYDGGRVPDDEIGYLLRYEPILFGEAPSECSLADTAAAMANFLAGLTGSAHRLVARKQTPAENLIDAALAMPNEQGALAEEILEIGEWSGMSLPVLGLPVQKSGRTTGLTTGTIVVVHATVSVSYGQDRLVKFVEQAITTPMSAGGDSGSLVLTNDPQKYPQSAVGLLFAGSEQSTVINDISHVVDIMGIDIP